MLTAEEAKEHDADFLVMNMATLSWTSKLGTGASKSGRRCESSWTGS